MTWYVAWLCLVGEMQVAWGERPPTSPKTRERSTPSEQPAHHHPLEAHYDSVVDEPPLS